MNVQVISVNDITNPVELTAWFVANSSVGVLTVLFVQGLFYIFYQ